MEGRLKVLGVAAGNGVSLYPYELDDMFKVIGNIEGRSKFFVNSNKVSQWELNFSSQMYTTFKPKFKRLNPDIIVGNPNCGASSILAMSRAKKYSDPMEDESVNAFINKVYQYTPKVFIMENLPKFLDIVNKNWLTDYFSDYNLTFITDSVSVFGNSQVSRSRLVIVGILKSLNVNESISDLIYSLELNKTISSFKVLLSGINTSKILNHMDIRENMDKVIAIHGGRKMSLREIADEWVSNRCDDRRWKTPGYTFSTAPGVWRCFADDYPPTVRATTRQFSPMGFPLSPRELAIIQGIPNSFQLYSSSDRDMDYYINKARVTVTKTPPYEVNYVIKEILKEIWLKEMK